MALPHDTKQRLVELAARYETAAFLEGDPSWFMHSVSGETNREATAFVASALSFGSRAQFMPKIASLIGAAGGDMDRWIRSGAYLTEFDVKDTRCFYRFFTYGAMSRFFGAYRALMSSFGTLGEYVRKTCEGDAQKAVSAICGWFSRNNGGGVVPKDAKSSCKRVCMFLRWMVRSGSPVDLGLWADFIDRRTLIVPLDTHVVQEAVALGLLRSPCGSMCAARRLTANLAEVFPNDPCRGDFALFGYGVDKSSHGGEA